MGVMAVVVVLQLLQMFCLLQDVGQEEQKGETAGERKYLSSFKRSRWLQWKGECKRGRSRISPEPAKDFHSVALLNPQGALCKVRCARGLGVTCQTMHCHCFAPGHAPSWEPSLCLSPPRMLVQPSTAASPAVPEPLGAAPAPGKMESCLISARKSSSSRGPGSPCQANMFKSNWSFLAPKFTRCFFQTLIKPFCQPWHCPVPHGAGRCHRAQSLLPTRSGASPGCANPCLSPSWPANLL